MYKAHDFERAEIVAFKFLPAALATGPENARRLAASLARARKISHPNVCRIYDSGEYNGQRFIAMELVEGRDLSALLRLEGPPTTEQVLSIAIQAAEGLGAIHEAGLVHRHLTTRKLVRDARGAIKILDLSHAQLAEGMEHTVVRGDTIVGTPSYMSPEQIRGEAVDSRADIYGLGVVIFEEFTGAVPFGGKSPSDVLRQHLNEEPPLERLPAEVRPIIAKALAKSREDRYRSAREMADALRQARVSLEPATDGEDLAFGSAMGEFHADEYAVADEMTVDAEPSVPAAAHEPPLATYENAQFTVYRPRAVEPMRWYPLLAFAHLEELPPGSADDERSPTDQVRQEAARLLGNLAPGYSDVRQDSSRAIPHDAEITFVPQIPGFEVNPPRATFLWLEPVHRQDFRMRARTPVDGQVARGRVSVFWGRIVLADVPVSIRIGTTSSAAEAGAPTEREAARPFRKVFASYSHKDVAVVEEIARYGRTLGDVYLRDVTHLRSGEQWDERLLDLIQDADVFQLFWSWNALHSSFVEREWRYALSLQRAHFIRPTYWQEPLPVLPERDLPPEALRRLHFQLLPAGAGGAAAHPPRLATAAAPAVSVTDQPHEEYAATVRMPMPTPAREHTGAMPAVSVPMRPPSPARMPVPSAASGPAPASRALLSVGAALLGVVLLGAVVLLGILLLWRR